MQSVQTFDFGDHPVRIVERNEQPWFVAADVCRVLEISNPRDAVSSLDDDEKDGVGITDAINRTQQTNCISESGLYALIFKSRKPEAKAFRKWVTSEVLPTLRRTGRYSIPISTGPEGVQGILEKTILAVYEDRCTPEKAASIAALSSQYLRLQAKARKAPPIKRLAPPPDPVGDFVRQCCELIPDEEAPKACLLAAFRQFLADNHFPRKSQEFFFRGLYANFPQLEAARHRSLDPAHYIRGIRINASANCATPPDATAKSRGPF